MASGRPAPVLAFPTGIPPRLQKGGEKDGVASPIMTQIILPRVAIHHIKVCKGRKWRSAQGAETEFSGSGDTPFAVGARLRA